MANRYTLTEQQKVVDVDFLSGKYGGDDGNVSKHIDEIKALVAEFVPYKDKKLVQKMKLLR